MPNGQRAHFRSQPDWLTTLPQGDGPGRLPIPLSTLVGRASDIASAATAIRDPSIRLVTLTGPGGVGKTRLALEVASVSIDEFPDGIHVVELSSIRESALVAPAIAHALEIRRTDDQPVLSRLKAVLRRAEMLLVIDNFEHVLEAAPMLSELLQSCPRLTALVTSRSLLQIAGERNVPVLPLPVPPTALLRDTSAAALSKIESVHLFVERVQAVQPEFELTAANASDIAAICMRLDGLPLAIELAAARSVLFPPAVMLARLDRRLPLLTGGARDLPGRQQTMRNAIGWSVDLLSDEEKHLYCGLSVFVGGATLEAARSVCWSSERTTISGQPATDDDSDLQFESSVESLIRQCLVQMAIPPVGPSRIARLTMLETVREYAADELTLRGRDAVDRAHAAYYLHLVSLAEPTFWGDSHGDSTGTIEDELGNLRTALTWAVRNNETETALHLAGALFDPTWMFDFHWLATDDARLHRMWVTQALALSGGSTESRVKALHKCGLCCRSAGRCR